MSWASLWTAGPSATWSPAPHCCPHPHPASLCVYILRVCVCVSGCEHQYTHMFSTWEAPHLSDSHWKTWPTKAPFRLQDRWKLTCVCVWLKTNINQKLQKLVWQNLSCVATAKRDQNRNMSRNWGKNTVFFGEMSKNVKFHMSPKHTGSHQVLKSNLVLPHDSQQPNPVSSPSLFPEDLRGIYVPQANIHGNKILGKLQLSRTGIEPRSPTPQGAVLPTVQSYLLQSKGFRSLQVHLKETRWKKFRKVLLPGAGIEPGSPTCQTVV